jgi:hypothetical protein
MRTIREVGDGVGTGVTPSEDILAIAVIDEASPRAVAVCGTGFLIADGLLVTAWHCVREPLKPGQRYVVCRKCGPDVYDPFPLDDIVQHPAGRDLASEGSHLQQLSGSPFSDRGSTGNARLDVRVPRPQLRYDDHGNRVLMLGLDTSRVT